MMRCKDSRVQNKPGGGADRERLGRTPWAAQSSPAAEAIGKEDADRELTRERSLQSP